MKYRLLRIEEIDGRQSIFKLECNGNCQFDEFWDKIEKEGNLASELDTIQSRLEDVANGKLLPKNKFRDITPNKKTQKEYEIKTSNLRVYLTKVENQGKLIILGGQKNSQQKDINKFRRIKRDFFNTI